MDDEDLDQILKEQSQGQKINLKQTYEIVCNSIIRPPRFIYEISNLGPKEITFKNKKFIREDLQLVNNRGLNLQCSFFQLEDQKEKRPCVIYCHGNGGSRLDAVEAFRCVLPVFNLFSFDFSGSGLSEGEYVSLGFFEKQDLETVVNYLRSSGKVSKIGIWGRSMGAATALMYAANDPAISGIVLDSAFSSLKKIAEELVEKTPLKIPKMMLSLGLKVIRRSIKNKASFDISELEPIKHAPKAKVPALFCHAKDDNFILPHHSKQLHDAYGGKKNLVMVEGDHNSQRPDFFYDSVVIFFHNNLLDEKEKQAIESEAFSESNEETPLWTFPQHPSSPIFSMQSTPLYDEDEEFNKAIAESLSLSNSQKVTQSSINTSNQEVNTSPQEIATCPICNKTLPNATIEMINNHIDQCLSTSN